MDGYRVWDGLTCGRTMVHWFSISERGTKMSIWNVAHNVGGRLCLPLTLGLYFVLE